MLPRSGEQEAEWLKRASVPSSAINRLVKRWQLCGHDPALFGMLGTADERHGGEKEIAWVVAGRLPRGCVTLLVGNNASGKSSLAHKWVAALGSTGGDTSRTVLSAEVTGEYVAALISGEDGEGVINYRAIRHSTIWGTPSYFVLDGVTLPLTTLLDILDRTPKLDLLVVDPVRAFLEGDEDSSAIVSLFYDRLTRIAREKNCAVVAVHHLTKSRPRSLGQMLPMVRGSSVHTDRARMVIGIIDRGSGVVEIGPIKNNFPAHLVWAKVNEGSLYRRDPDTFTVVSLANNATSEASEKGGGDATSRVFTAIRERNEAGAVVRRTGKSGLYETRATGLADLSRSAVLIAIGTLIDAGPLKDGDNGLTAVDLIAATSVCS